MKVSETNNFDTHTILGGSNIRSFSMADSPEFYEVLSSTLYSNKKLAVVREVLCNSWDAHIITDRQDVPVQVELGEDYMSFRDFGPGISDEMIAPIYCVYGGSTKTANDKETGGFGLGSKAPFSYVDHITVTSHHAGLKYVYVISKGSEESGGKPDIRTIVGGVPTEESGIEVKMAIQRKDRFAFESLINSVAYNGSMNVKLNGYPVKVLSNRIQESGFAILRKFQGHTHGHYVYVRYGSVIYPIEHHEEYSDEYRQLEEILPKLYDSSTANYHYGRPDNSTPCIILQAEPNTLVPTPSREHLTTLTSSVQAIKTLLEKFLNQIKEDRDLALEAVLEWYAQKPENITTLIARKGRLKNPTNSHFMSDAEYDVAEVLCKHIPEILFSVNKETLFLISNKQYYKTLFRILPKFTDKYRQEIRLARKYVQRWMYRKKVYTSLDDTIFKIFNLYSFEQTLKDTLPEKLLKKVEIFRYSTFHAIKDYTYTSILPKKIVLINSKVAYREANEHHDLNVATMKLSPTQAKQAKVLLEDAGWDVDVQIDLTAKVRATGTGRPRGFPRLKDGVDCGRIRTGITQMTDIDRIAKPTVVVLLNKDRYYNNLESLQSVYLDTLAKLIPNAAIVATEDTHHRWSNKEGVMSGYDYIESRFKHHGTDLNFVRWAHEMFENTENDFQIPDLLRLKPKYQFIYDYYGFKPITNPEQKLLLNLFNLNGSFYRNYIGKRCATEMGNVFSKNNFARIRKNREMTELINFPKLVDNCLNKPKKADMQVDLVKLALT